MSGGSGLKIATVPVRTQYQLHVKTISLTKRDSELNAEAQTYCSVLVVGARYHVVGHTGVRWRRTTVSSGHVVKRAHNHDMKKRGGGFERLGRDRKKERFRK